MTIRIIIAAFLATAFHSCSGFKAFMNPDPSSVNIEEVHPETFPDSIYRGEYAVGPVKVVMDVTVKDRSITQIELLKHRTGQGQSAEQITDSVLVHQSVCIDVISGATISSTCILKAVETALSKESEQGTR